VIQGYYTSLSIAIYGDILSEMAPPLTSYVPQPLTSVEPLTLSRPLDPANALNPTELGNQLLCLVSDAPPLPLVVRLMLCQKPRTEDWDDSRFPYIYADLADDICHFNLEGMYHLTKMLLPDDVPVDTKENMLATLARLICDATVAKTLTPFFSSIILT
jgi:hypothetical protein